MKNGNEIRCIITFTSKGAVTLVPRILPLLVFSKLQIPEWGLKWLNYIPIAILAALLAQVLFMHETMQWDYLIVAIPTFLVAIYTRSLLGTVLTGVVVIILLRFFLKGLRSYNSEKCNNMKNIGWCYDTFNDRSNFVNVVYFLYYRFRYVYDVC